MEDRPLREALASTLAGQFAAAMCTLWQAISGCPEKEWHNRHADHPFSQVVFHVLLYTDLYLGRDEASCKTQDYHMNNRSFFGDYEEFEDSIPQNLYEKPKIREYFGFCLEKGERAIREESLESLLGPSGFPMKKFSRLELYLYLIRHIQHHAAQLGLRLQPITGKELAWISSGWKDLA